MVIQDDFARSGIAKGLCRAWLRDQGEAPNDELLTECFTEVLKQIPSDRIISTCYAILGSCNASERDKAEARRILARNV